MLGAAPGGDIIDSSLIPASLADWVTHQGVTHDGAGLRGARQALAREGLLEPFADRAGTRSAVAVSTRRHTRSPGSAAGSSYDRIDRLFTQLNERAGSGRQTLREQSLVAAVGDDEQFAAAVALIAADLGFPARVVLGARLDGHRRDWLVCTRVCRRHVQGPKHGCVDRGAVLERHVDPRRRHAAAREPTLARRDPAARPQVCVGP